MGGGESQPVFPDPWRQVSWGDNQKKLQHVKQYEPKGGDIKHLRVLLYGPVGSGKSSFINSVSTTLRGKCVVLAEVNATTSDKSHTKKYKTHRIKKESSLTFYPIVFNDIMGLEDGSGNGVRVDDIRLAMMGHVQEGYTFNPASSLSQDNPGYNPSPSPDDKVHVLVCVHSTTSPEITESVIQKMREIREVASKLGIPQIAVATKVDQACGETEKSLKNVYKSKHLKKKMSDFSSTVGIPINCIFPIKNYSEETSPDGDVDTLILDVVKEIIHFGDDFLDKSFTPDCPNMKWIPQIAVSTKVDKSCGETEKSLRNVYKSKHQKKIFGIPMNCIFPIKNYSEETSPDEDVDTLILHVVKKILNFGDDFLDKS